MGSDKSQKLGKKDVTVTDETSVKLVEGKPLIFMLIIVGFYVAYQWWIGEASWNPSFNVVSPILILLVPAFIVGITRKMFVGRFKSLRRTIPYIFTYSILLGFATLFFDGLGYWWVMLILPVCGIILGKGSDLFARKVAPNLRKKAKVYLSTLEKMKETLKKNLTVSIEIGRILKGWSATAGATVTGQPQTLVTLDTKTNKITQSGTPPYDPKLATTLETTDDVVWGAPVASVTRIIELLEELTKHQKEEVLHEMNQKLPAFANAVSSLFENAHNLKWENQKVRALGKRLFMEKGKTEKQVWMYKKYGKNQSAINEINDILIKVSQILSDMKPMVNLEKINSPIRMAEADKKAFKTYNKKGLEYKEVKESDKFRAIINRIGEYVEILQSKYGKVEEHGMDNTTGWPQELIIEYWSNQGYTVQTRGKIKKVGNERLVEELEATKDK